MYAVLGHSGTTASAAGNLQAHSVLTPDSAPIYWSTPSTPEATPSPNHVREAKKAASPVPEEGVSSQEGPGAPVTVSTNDDGVKQIVMDDDIDVDAFLAKLLAEDETLTGDMPAAAQPAHAKKVLTEEEKEEEKRMKELETKMKREEITRRHTKWEKRLQEAGEEEELELLAKVAKMRTEVVDGMRSKPEMFELLKKMQSEGFKHIDNTEKYLNKMEKEGKPDEEAQKKWKTIVEKVSKKLDDRTIETSTYLQNWHREIMQKEKVVFEASAKVVEDAASDAQTDLGMDYAWLDDVTTNDWTRYHKLKDDSKKWIEVYETIFNSTHPDMGENPVVTELLQVQTAMVRVAADLKAGLDKVKLKGDIWVRGEPENTAVASSATATDATAIPGVTPPATAEKVEEEDVPPVPEHVGEASTPAVSHEEL